MWCGVCQYVNWLLPGARLQCVIVVSWRKHAQMKCHAFSWKCHSKEWLYSLRCLFALGSWYCYTDWPFLLLWPISISQPLFVFSITSGKGLIHKSITMALTGFCNQGVSCSPIWRSGQTQYCLLRKPVTVRSSLSTHSCWLRGADKASGNGQEDVTS